MLAYQMLQTIEQQETADLTDLTSSTATSDAGQSATVNREVPKEERQTKTVRFRRNGEVVETELTLRPGYQWRQANWEIGRAAERSKAAQAVVPFKPGDRFAAWRKSAARKVKNAERRMMGRSGKKK